MSSHREAEKDYLYVKYFAAMIFIIVGGFMVSFSYSDGISHVLLAIDSKTTSATVYENKTDSRSRTFHLKYQFYSENGELLSNSRTGSHKILRETRVGENINVTYFPMYPKISEATFYVRYLKTGFWIMTIGFVFVIAASFASILTLFQMIRFRREDRFY